jgi:hypothetical protein
MNGVKTKVLAPASLNENDTLLLQFRDEVSIWLFERLNHPNSETFRGVNHERMKYLQAHFGARYVCFVNTIGYKGKAFNLADLGNLFLSVVVPIYFHFALFNLLTPDHYSFLIIPIFDLETGKLIFTYYKPLDNLEKKDLIKAEFYQFFNKISHGKN